MTDVTQGMQELLSRLPKTDTYPFRSIVNPEYSQKHIALSLTPANLLFAMLRAREAQELAVSYRSFNVGAAVIGLSFAPSNFQIMTGVNVKPDEESQMNVHAEQVALQKARDRGADAVSMVVVVGNTQADKQSGNNMHTLHPCGLCRGVMDHDPMIHNEATLVASTLPDFSVIELYTIEALKTYHDTQDDTGITRIELPNLSLFKPVEHTSGYIHLEDSAELQQEERIWNDTVGTYLTERRLTLLNGLS